MASSFGPIRLASRALAFAQATCSTLARPNWGGPRFVLIDLRGSRRPRLGRPAPPGAPLAFKKPGVWPQSGSARGQSWDLATARMCGASARRPCARPGGIGMARKGGQAAGKAPILASRPSFDGYSRTFREPPSRPTWGNALTCGNADGRPRSTRGVAESIRITEKTAGAGVHKPIDRVTAGPCPTIPFPRPATLGLRTMTDATIPTESGIKVSVP